MLSRGMMGTLAVFAALACGPDDAREVAEQDEVCGEPGPVRILELEDEPGLWSIAGRWIGERRLLSVSYTDGDGRLDPTRFEQWSVGPCGESPRLLAPDTATWRVLDVWPDTLLGCHIETAEIATIDPDGERAPHVVFDVDDCNALDETPWGLVDVEPQGENTGALVLLRYPEDPWTGVAERTVLIDEIRIRADPPHTFPEQHEVLEVRDDELFAITPADELVRYSLLDGSITTEATGVREFYLSADLRWLIWQDVADLGGDPEWPPGAIFLRDRSSGETFPLDAASLAATTWSPLQFIEYGFVQLQMGRLYQEPQRFYEIPSLASFDVPVERNLSRPLDDGRWLVTDALGRAPLETFEPASGTFASLFDRTGMISRSDDDHAEVIENGSCCNDISPHIASGPLWSVPYDGVPEMLARRATSSYAFLTDDRLLTAVAVDSDGLGELVVVEPGELTERRVDEHVVARWPELDPDDTIVYGVADGDRTGVWLARLAPD